MSIIFSYSCLAIFLNYEATILKASSSLSELAFSSITNLF
jgi:hypothetical protein